MAYKRLLEEFNLKQDEVAERVAEEQNSSNELYASAET